jgi:hypothetical protein
MSQSDIPPYTYIKLHSVNTRTQHEYQDIMVTALFRVATQRAVVIYITDVSEQPICRIFKGQELSHFYSLKMGLICCPETSVRNYHHSLRNNPEESSYHQFRVGSLKLRLRIFFSGDMCLFSSKSQELCRDGTHTKGFIVRVS